MTQSKTEIQNLRWVQRYQNFCAAHAQLRQAVQTAQQRPLNDLEKQGLIQAFEFTHELAWNVLKDYFQYQGNSQITGSRDATREAFNKGIIDNGSVWMEMIKSRNQSSHTYNRATAEEIVDKILNEYKIAFESFANSIQHLIDKL